jgi:hypothetical protein
VAYLGGREEYVVKLDDTEADVKVERATQNLARGTRIHVQVPSSQIRVWT